MMAIPNFKLFPLVVYRVAVTKVQSSSTRINNSYTGTMWSL